MDWREAWRGDCGMWCIEWCILVNELWARSRMRGIVSDYKRVVPNKGERWGHGFVNRRSEVRFLSPAPDLPFVFNDLPCSETSVPTFVPTISRTNCFFLLSGLFFFLRASTGILVLRLRSGSPRSCRVRRSKLEPRCQTDAAATASRFGHTFIQLLSFLFASNRSLPR